MRSLSLFVITKNEQANLSRCLELAKPLVDEIIVLDSGSTDNTQEIAEKFGAKFSFRQFDGFGQQKRAAESLCKNDWVLNLDADEFLTPEVIAEITHFLSSDMPQRYNGARVKTVGLYPHHEKPRFLADYHNYIRLYNRELLSYPNHPTKDAIVVTSEKYIYHLKNIILHRSFPDLKTLNDKARGRTRFYFQNENPKSQFINILRMVIEFPLAFFKCYILRRHFTGGFYGAKISYIYAKYRFIRIVQRVMKRALV